MRIVHCFIVIFHCFSFNIWLNRKQLDAHDCCCVQSVAISHVMQPLETLLYTHKKVRVKRGKKKKSSYYYENSSDFVDFLKRSQAAPPTKGT